jgi:hypothetical protein
MTIPRTTPALFPFLLSSRQVTIVLGSFKAALDAELHNIPHTRFVKKFIKVTLTCRINTIC